MKKPLLLKVAFSSLFMSIVVGAFLFQSCDQQEYMNENKVDEAILNSPELEDAIIASIELQQTLNAFNSEIKKIDFSKLEFVDNGNGEKIMRLPITVKIDDKLQTFNTKKNSFLKKYPQFTSLQGRIKKEYFQKCIDNSLKINNKLLDLDINIHLPMTKDGVMENFNNYNSLMSFLGAWVQNPNYTEVYIIVFKDGTAMTYQDTNSTQNQGGSPTMQQIGNKFYYKGKEIDYVGHTHTNSCEASDTDKNNNTSGLDHYIYYDGTMYNY